jgi:hypothetical protein
MSGYHGTILWIDPRDARIFRLRAPGLDQQGGTGGYTDYPALVASDAGSSPVGSPRTLLETAVGTLQR